MLKMKLLNKISVSMISIVVWIHASLACSRRNTIYLLLYEDSFESPMVLAVREVNERLKPTTSYAVQTSLQVTLICICDLCGIKQKWEHSNSSNRWNTTITASEKIGEGALSAFWGGGAGSPSNTMWLGPRPTCIQSFILIRSTVWPQYTNVTDRQTTVW